MAGNGRKTARAGGFESLTRAELLELVRRKAAVFMISDEDLMRGLRECMLRKARALMDEAMAEMEIHRGGDAESLPAFLGASAKFDRGMAMYERAAQLLDLPEEGRGVEVDHG